jgi:lipopolysaccharide heptosyltransferase II
MNILQLVPKLNVGGVEKGTIEVARHLTLKGHKAVVVSGGGVMEKNLTAVGARYYCLPIGRKNPFLMFYCYFKLKDIIRKEKIDIVHARSRVPALIGFFAAKTTLRTFITTAHGQYRKHLLSRVMGWGKVVICANETMACHMKNNFNVPVDRIKIIPRGVDLEKFFFRPFTDRDKKNFKVGMISRYSPLKGHLDFLQAVAYLSRKVHNLKAVIMGDTSSAKDEYLRKIDLAVKRLKLKNIVEFRESHENVCDVLSELDCFVSANREQEAFGRSVIEAQARGIPVVATRVGGVAENIRDGQTGLLCSARDPSGMSETILKFALDKNLYESIAVNARKFVEKNYSLEKMMALTLHTYQEVLGQKNILIFKISSLGDIILSVPSLRAIRNKFKTAVIKVMVDVKFREVLENCPYIDEVITCDFSNRDKGLNLLRLAGNLRKDNFDISIDFQNNRKSHLLSFLASIPERYGYNNGKYSLFLNRKIRLPEKKVSPVEHQGYISGLLGITHFDASLELWESPESQNWADELLKNEWLKKDQEIIAFSLSASEKWKTKNWPITNFAKLADMLAVKRSARVLLVGTEASRAHADEFMKKTDVKPINAVGRTDINGMISLIKRCDAVVTGDSAPMHVASAAGIPFVALFGPTDPRRHLPSQEKARVISGKTRCSPCYKATCFLGCRCMKAIKPEEVFDCLRQIIPDKPVITTPDSM